MQSIIVYSNALDAMMWKMFGSGDVTPFMLATIVFFTVVLIINRPIGIILISKKLVKRESNIPLFVSIIIAGFLSCIVIKLMWLT